MAIAACPVIFLAETDGAAIKTLKNLTVYGLPAIAFIWHIFGTVVIYNFSPDNDVGCDAHLYNLSYTVVTLVNVIISIVIVLVVADYLKLAYVKVFEKVPTGYEASSDRENAPWQVSPTRVINNTKKSVLKATGLKKKKKGSDVGDVSGSGPVLADGRGLFHEDPEQNSTSPFTSASLHAVVAAAKTEPNYIAPCCDDVAAAATDRSSDENSFEEIE